MIIITKRYGMLRYLLLVNMLLCLCEFRSRVVAVVSIALGLGGMSFNIMVVMAIERDTSSVRIVSSALSASTSAAVSTTQSR